uniref:(northern house mosquito) hypothetical protein n=1 Tax=Culex pipiens TaxID=7175 RepID=A0A8D8G3Q0_CULPI
MYECEILPACDGCTSSVANCASQTPGNHFHFHDLPHGDEPAQCPASTPERAHSKGCGSPSSESQYCRTSRTDTTAPRTTSSNRPSTCTRSHCPASGSSSAS